MKNLKTLLILAPTLETQAAQSLEEAENLEWIWCNSFQDLFTAQKEISFVLIDVDLPHSNLRGLLNDLRNTYTNAEFFALSQNHSTRFRKHCLELGFNEFLVKPVSQQEIAWYLSRSFNTLDSLAELGIRSQLLRTYFQMSRCVSLESVHSILLKHLKDLFNAKEVTLFKLSKSGVAKSISSTEKKPIKAPSLKSTKGWITQKQRYIRFSESGSLFLLIEKPKSGLTPKNKKETAFLWKLEQNLAFQFDKLIQFRIQTFEDDLTGLYNSRYLKIVLEEALQKYKLASEPFSVLFIDLDHFKKINDSYGHDIGSLFLSAFAQTLRSRLRKQDLVFRYGGDEFVVLLPNAGSETAFQITELIRTMTEKRVFRLGSFEVKATLSIGLASIPEHTTNKMELLRLADQALYDVKKKSRNAVVMANLSKSKKSTGRKEAELR